MKNFYGMPQPLFPQVTIAYIGDQFGFFQLARHCKVVSFGSDEADLILDSVECQLLVITPIAGRAADTDWVSAGELDSLEDFSAYKGIIAAARARGVPVVGWLHNDDSKTAAENTILAQAVDILWLPDEESLKNHPTSGKEVFFVPNFPCSPLTALRSFPIRNVSNFGVGFQDVTTMALRNNVGKNYRSLFEDIGFVYVDATELPRAQARQHAAPFRAAYFRELSSEIDSADQPYQFVGFRANSGIKQTYDFLNCLFQGSFPIGVIDPNGQSVQKRPLHKIFRSANLQSYEVEAIRRKGASLIDPTRYWRHWLDAVKNAFFTPHLAQALRGALLEPSRLPSEVRIVRILGSRWEQPDPSQYAEAIDVGSFILYRGEQNILFLRTSDGFRRLEKVNDVECILNSGPGIISIDSYSPTPELIHISLILSRGLRGGFEGQLPSFSHNGNLNWVNIKF